ncbi:transcriptional Coactivator p15-domain-containing protein [Xylaria bambusicola]|uniref:transcriptional Coactivator p15-domain-containing protein n=1 Tax=Xylaria bambusicola TaxID=326684 RepID=UPI0020074E9F|nr:transcriptional Coactivator p15-domain-containing protein [Xylaria bambusicola]KAI0509415.1 transcriptional Coactivator p15-domain-containing protein [Xylaria bambusicola]
MGRVSKKRHADVSSDEEVAQPSKKTKTKTAAEPGKDDEGNSFWPLSATRRVVIQNFKGKNYVNFREYYSDAGGELKPTKKGIMLTLEQYNDLLTAIPALNAELQSKGHDVPDIFATSSNKSAPKPATKSPPKDQTRKKKKMNIEATSDEEEPESD